MRRVSALVGVAALGQGLLLGCAAVLWWLASDLVPDQNGFGVLDGLLAAGLTGAGVALLLAGIGVVVGTRRTRVRSAALIVAVNGAVGIVAAVGAPFLEPAHRWMGVGVALVAVGLALAAGRALRHAASGTAAPRG